MSDDAIVAAALDAADSPNHQQGIFRTAVVDAFGNKSGRSGSGFGSGLGLLRVEAMIV